MPKINYYNVTLTVKMKVTGPVSHAGAIEAAIASVPFSPVDAGLSGAKVSEMRMAEVWDREGR